MNALSPPPSGKAVSATRRGVIVGATLTGGALLVGCSPADIVGFDAQKPDLGAFGPFIKITPDNWVTVINKHQEMGQGNHAGLAAIVAEELDADWDKVRVEASVANAKLYANTLMGVQGTGGSTAINNSWDQLRLAGAAARSMFVQAAASRFGVPARDLVVKDSIVSHVLSGRSASFADLLADAGKIAPPKSPTLKRRADFTLIGTDRVRRKDSQAKSTGTARYTQDVHLPNMLTAVVAHPQKFGAKVRSFDDSAARKVDGVVDVVEIPTGVAVIAQSTYAARQGRDALKVVWNEDKAETRSSDQILADYKAIVAGKGDVKPHVFQTAGDAAHAFDGELFEATYDFPYLAHASMEAMNCVATVDGHKVKLVFASQIPTLDQLNAAMIVGCLPGTVDIEILPAGGSFGRRANPTSDYAVECVHIAKHVGHGRPVKLVWTREDDMTGGRYRPLAHHAIAIKTGADGYPRRLAPPHRHPVDPEGRARGQGARRERLRGDPGLTLSEGDAGGRRSGLHPRLPGARPCGGARWARPTRPWPWSTPSTSWPTGPERTPPTTAAPSTARPEPIGIWPPSTWPARRPAGASRCRREPPAAWPCTKASAPWSPRWPRSGCRTASPGSAGWSPPSTAAWPSPPT